ncbi:NAD(P)-binding protein [Corynespora cassiicola Philippines]|uniref:NAD(P)-binding protein n=1 Tax=Corynespora cassiicola Philippines TaxID=1448308 RepID=A0A2T2NK72_CORCC|nr:NAD(P)-binding protein [Corynespora cassiicola Philippines]
MSLAKKVILITGGASGIGLATAHLLASRGATVCLADVNRDALDKAEKDIKARHPGAEVLCTPVDVRKPEDVKAWVEKVVSLYEKIDGAANLAGVIGKSIGVSTIADLDIDEWDFIMDVNLRGVMLCLKYELQHLSPGGSIVNASSIAGVQGRAKNAAYSASKHAVIGLTRSAAKEFGEKGIRVNAICPGYIITPMNETARRVAESQGQGKTEERSSEAFNVALKRTGEAEEVASLIAFLLGDESKFITGASYSVDGGWNC